MLWSEGRGRERQGKDQMEGRREGGKGNGRGRTRWREGGEGEGKAEEGPDGGREGGGEVGEGAMQGEGHLHSPSAASHHYHLHHSPPTPPPHLSPPLLTGGPQLLTRPLLVYKSGQSVSTDGFAPASHPPLIAASGRGWSPGYHVRRPGDPGVDAF